MRVVALEDNVDFFFTSRNPTDDNQAATLASGAIEVYEDNGTTQITAADTLTADFDSITGLNQVRIAATAANGFEAGKVYNCVISAGTVAAGAVSLVGEVVYEFRVETVAESAARQLYEALYPTSPIIATTTSNSTTAINLTDIVDAQTPDASLPGTVLLVQDATDDHFEVVVVTASSSLVAAVERVADGGAMGFTVAAGDGVWIIGHNPRWGAEQAVIDYKLDHLVAVAESDDPADDSIIAKLAAGDGDWSTFVASTDALQAFRDATIAAGGDGVNVKEINDVALTGDGTSGTEWGPA